MSWRSIDVPITELCIDTVLRSGQSFRWKLSGPQEYSCAIHGRVITLKQDATKLYYKTIFPTNITSQSVDPAGVLTVSETDNDREEFRLQETQKFLKHYLNLEPDLGLLYSQWSEKDKNFAKKAPKFHGVRILKQDAWEALVGFICSSCNNIKRISQMMDKLCANYGPLISHIDDMPYYDMPSPAALVNPKVEGHLRELGFGYRAAYLFQTAQMIAREKDGWLDSLRNPENPVFGHKASPAGPMQPEGREGYRDAHAALVELQGVGAKVADCVCLFGLGWGEAVPVDTHVWQIAQRDYGFGRGKHKSLTKATYDAVANYFRQLWGKEAGWAHSVLFAADLKTFAEKAAASIVESEEVLDIIKTEVDPESTIIETTLAERPADPSLLVDAPSTSIKEEMIVIGENNAPSMALGLSDVDIQGVPAQNEIKCEPDEVLNSINGEDENGIPDTEGVRMKPLVTTNKRRLSGRTGQRKVDDKTELVEQSLKRRRSNRLGQ